MNIIIHKSRIVLIRVGKILPFAVCCIVLFSCLESQVAIGRNDFIYWSNYAIPNTFVSFFIADYFEYNIQMLAVLIIISIAIETCIYNKLACLYLGINIFEKSYFDFELEPTAIYIICIANIIVAGYLTVKGIKIISRKQ